MLLINDTNTKSANTLDTIFAEMTNIAPATMVLR